ncbi:phosphopantetheine-binding protein, partial [Streptomyces sp. WAC01526]|uniref:phosphopantetheine-binding protein n=1 Tax=Streptomyces sp. WAC01526 TaxID=2588709 RepID=UPI0021CC6F7F
EGALLDGGAAPGAGARSDGGATPGAGAWSDGGAAAGDSARHAAVLEYLRTTRELVAAQRDVVLRYLGEAVAPAQPVGPAPAAEWTVLPHAETDEAGAGPAVAAAADADADADAGAAAVAQAPAPGPRLLSPSELLDAVREIIHQRTGYPHEMLDAGLDLEADLSVDSIKRVEIIGALADRIGLSQDADGAMESAVEQLARVKTISGIVDWIAAARAEPPPAPAEPAPAPVTPAALSAPAAPAAPTAPTAPPQPAVSAPVPTTQDPAALAETDGGPAVLRPTRSLVRVTPRGPPAARPPAEVVAGGPRAGRAG